MSTRRNGITKASIRVCNGVVREPSERSSLDAFDDNSAFSGNFKGFAQCPVVKIERLDITPFIKPPISAIKSLKMRKSTRSNSKHFTSLTRECSVKINRDNLQELKNSLQNKPIGAKVGQRRLQCRVCEKVYDSEKKLQNHKNNKHVIVYEAQNCVSKKRVSFSDNVIVHELQEYHRCRKCPKIFEDYKSLRAHTRQRHRKRKCYICHYCSKSFMDRMFFKVHIKLHCDVCGQLLPNRTKYLDHRRNVCRVLKLHKCRTCNDSYFRIMDLKDHSYEHISTCFVCDICKDQFLTKCDLSHHISFLHTKRHSNTLYNTHTNAVDSLYVCNFCDTNSKDEKVLEKHVETLPDLSNSVMTDYKDYSFCNQCFRKFETEKDMLQHKWSHFLTTSDNSQLRSPKSILKPSPKLIPRMSDTKKCKVVLERLKFDLKSQDDIDNSSALKKTEDETANSGSILENLLSNSQMSQTDGQSAEEDSNLEIKNVDTDLDVKNTDNKKKHWCEICGRYYTAGFTLRRHKAMVHNEPWEVQCKTCKYTAMWPAVHDCGDVANSDTEYTKSIMYSSKIGPNVANETYRCNVCEETFAWKALLEKHRCLRSHIPEGPFQDARPEIQFDNMADISDHFGDINADDSYMDAVDFEIPAPIVEFQEIENCTYVPPSIRVQRAVVNSYENKRYKVVMQEVPIEF